MPRIEPDLVILIREKGVAISQKIDIYRLTSKAGKVNYIKIKINGKWLDNNNTGSPTLIRWFNFRDILWRSIGRRFIRGY